MCPSVHVWSKLLQAHKLSHEARKRFASTLVHTLWQEAPVTGQPQSELNDFLSFDDLEVWDGSSSQVPRFP